MSETNARSVDAVLEKFDNGLPLSYIAYQHKLIRVVDIEMRLGGCASGVPMQAALVEIMGDFDNRVYVVMLRGDSSLTGDSWFIDGCFEHEGDKDIEYVNWWTAASIISDLIGDDIVIFDPELNSHVSAGKGMVNK